MADVHPCGCDARWRDEDLNMAPPADAVPETPLPAFARRTPAGLELRLKVVPGASRSTLAGALGDRLKVRVAAPPEGGKANRAVLELVAAWLGGRRVELIAGHASAEKTVLAAGLASLTAAQLAHAAHAPRGKP
jgi:hypothetical protein